MDRTQTARVRFGGFELDLKTGELHATAAAEGENGRRVVLQEQPFRLLVLLVGREGALVGREEIKKQFWPNDTIVEFDHSINVAIGKLRKAMGDSAEDPKYIETLARRGYRLMVPVEWVNGTATADGRAMPLPNGLPGASQTSSARQVDPEALAGRTISHYRVLDVIGGGGMGVVYRAEDLKLGRRVALKFLPEELGNDPNALERFEREARAASSLDHPNICPVHEFGEHDGRPFMVMQLLEGQTLRDRLAVAEGALPVDELLDIAIQVSDGLQAAHDRGIAHRDIKPANIFITSKRVCKILDFGLAKLLEVGDEGEPALQPVSMVSSAATGLTLTRTGSAMGTAGYMSPEQVRGEKLDARSDLFSFGLVLYEMGTGQRAFRGETSALVYDAILHTSQTPARNLNSAVPAELAAIIDKLLEKDREARYQTAAEISVALRQLQRPKHGDAPKGRLLGRWLLLAAATLAIVSLALGWRLQWLKRWRGAPRPMLSERQLTHNPSEFRLIAGAISPDGKHLAYTDPKGLHVSVIATGEVHDIQVPEEWGHKLASVNWFPDGERVIVMADSIWSVSIFGGIPRKVSSDGLWPVVSPQGSLIAFVSGDLHGVWVIGPDGENPRKILSDENKVYDALAWSPVGQRLAYMARSPNQRTGAINTVSLDGGPPTVVAGLHLQSDDASGMVWAPDGRIIYTLDEGTSSNLWQITADPRTGQPAGVPVKITNWDGLVTYWATISRDGNRLAIVRRYDRNDIYVGELKEAGMRLLTPASLTASQSESHATGWMRDDTVLLVSNRTGRSQIYRQRIGRDSAQPLIPGPDEQDGAEPSPDQQWILYWSTASEREATPTTQKLMRFSPSGGVPQQVLESRLNDASIFHCPEVAGASCVYSRWEKNEMLFYALDAIKGRGKEIARTSLEWSTILDWSLSRDGSQIAVSSLDRLPEQIRIINLKNHTERNMPVPHGWRILLTSWAADGKAMFAEVGGTQAFLARIGLDGKAQVLLDRGRSQWLNTPCASPDGRHLAFSEQIIDSNVWLMENF